jgi:hypothetical protein
MSESIINPSFIPLDLDSNPQLTQQRLQQRAALNDQLIQRKTQLIDLKGKFIDEQVAFTQKVDAALSQMRTLNDADEAIVQSYKDRLNTFAQTTASVISNSVVNDPNGSPETYSNVQYTMSKFVHDMQSDTQLTDAVGAYAAYNTRLAKLSEDTSLSAGTKQRMMNELEYAKTKYNLDRADNKCVKLDVAPIVEPFSLQSLVAIINQANQTHQRTIKFDTTDVTDANRRIRQLAQSGMKVDPLLLAKFNTQITVDEDGNIVLPEQPLTADDIVAVQHSYYTLGDAQEAALIMQDLDPNYIADRDYRADYELRAASLLPFDEKRERLSTMLADYRNDTKFVDGKLYLNGELIPISSDDELNHVFSRLYNGPYQRGINDLYGTGLSEQLAISHNFSHSGGKGESVEPAITDFVPYIDYGTNTEYLPATSYIDASINYANATKSLQDLIAKLPGSNIKFDLIDTETLTDSLNQYFQDNPKSTLEVDYYDSKGRATKVPITLDNASTIASSLVTSLKGSQAIRGAIEARASQLLAKQAGKGGITEVVIEPDPDAVNKKVEHWIRANRDRVSDDVYNSTFFVRKAAADTGIEAVTYDGNNTMLFVAANQFGLSDPSVIRVHPAFPNLVQVRNDNPDGTIQWTTPLVTMLSSTHSNGKSNANYKSAQQVSEVTAKIYGFDKSDVMLKTMGDDFVNSARDAIAITWGNQPPATWAWFNGNTEAGMPTKSHNLIHTLIGQQTTAYTIDGKPYDFSTLSIGKDRYGVNVKSNRNDDVDIKLSQQPYQIGNKMDYWAKVTTKDSKEIFIPMSSIRVPVAYNLGYEPAPLYMPVTQGSYQGDYAQYVWQSRVKANGGKPMVTPFLFNVNVPESNIYFYTKDGQNYNLLPKLIISKLNLDRTLNIDGSKIGMPEYDIVLPNTKFYNNPYEE